VWGAEMMGHAYYAAVVHAENLGLGSVDGVVAAELCAALLVSGTVVALRLRTVYAGLA
jgi:hypothetical protein